MLGELGSERVAWRRVYRFIGSVRETIEMNRLIICTAKPPATIEGMAVCPGKDIAVSVGFFLIEVNIRGATDSFEGQQNDATSIMYASDNRA